MHSLLFRWFASLSQWQKQQQHHSTGQLSLMLVDWVAAVALYFIPYRCKTYKWLVTNVIQWQRANIQHAVRSKQLSNKCKSFFLRLSLTLSLPRFFCVLFSLFVVRFVSGTMPIFSNVFSMRFSLQQRINIHYCFVCIFTTSHFEQREEWASVFACPFFLSG